MKVRIDLDKCMMAGECYFNHPEVFKRGRDALPTLVAGQVDEEIMIKQVLEAIEVCPSGAIIVED